MPDSTTDTAAPSTQRPQRQNSRRFEARREAIIASAVSEINHRGVRGMTLGDVAARLGLVSTAVIYYFKNKEELASAAFLKSIERFEQLAAEAASRATGAERVEAFVRNYFAFRRRVKLGQAAEIADVSDLRSLRCEVAHTAYEGMFRHIRSLIPSTPEQTRADRTGRAIYLLAELTWAPAWIFNWRVEDYARIGDRMADVLIHGIASPGAEWRSAAPAISPLEPEAAVASYEQFLRAATFLINDEGYHGASVDRISARLNVTKGAFYHHIDTKDDLVVACFERTFALMWRAIDEAEAAAGTGLQTIALIAETLIHKQLTEAPLLRTSALATVPEAMRGDLLNRLRRITIRFASILCDGIRDGTIRPVDTTITAQIITAAINAASEIPFWRPDGTPEENVTHYVQTMMTGIISGG